MRKISANPSHTEHWRMWGEGRLSDAGLATSISHIPPAIDQSPKSQLYTQRGRSRRCDSMTAQIGGYCTDEWRPPNILLGYKYAYKVYGYVHVYIYSINIQNK